MKERSHKIYKIACCPYCEHPLWIRKGKTEVLFCPLCNKRLTRSQIKWKNKPLHKSHKTEKPITQPFP